MGRKRNQPLLKMIKRELHRKNPRCSYCSHMTYLSDKNPEGRMALATIDHVRPRARQGTDSPKNLVLACQACNIAKDTMPLLEFLLLRDGTTDRGARVRAGKRKIAKRAYERYRSALNENLAARMA